MMKPLRNLFRLKLLLLFSFFAVQNVHAQTPTYFNNNTASPSNSFPWATAAGKGVQNFFPANSFPGAYYGLITKVYYKVSPSVTTTFTNLTIQFAQTTNTALTTGALTTNVTFTSVYTSPSATLSSNSSGWLEITLQTPFLYDPSLALIADVFNCAASGTGMSTANFTPGPSPTRTYINNSGCTPVYSGQDAITAAFGFDQIPAGPCTSPPTAGTATASNANPCLGQSVVLNLNGQTQGSGQTYQWEESFTPGGPFSPIGNPSNFSSLSITANSTMYYRAAVTCNSITAYSNEVLVTVPAPYPGGTYTINSAQPTGSGNFQSFTAAVAAISCGISGPVVFNVASGSGPYNEQINIPPTVGSNATNTVTFNGNGCTLTQTITLAGANYATLNIDGADYITFNNLNIEALGPTYGFGVHLMGAADNNTFNNCNITASTTATATTSVAVSMSGSSAVYSTAGTNGMNNTFSGCTITGGYFALAFYGSSVTGNTNNNIINCTIREFYIYGVYLLQQGSSTIAGNIIERPTRTVVTTSGYGIVLTTGCSNILVEKNHVRKLWGAAPASTGTTYCLYDAIAATVGNENKFYNNLVSDIDFNGTIYGLYFSGANYVKAYHNTISLDQTTATGVTTTHGMYSTGTVGVDMRNNNVSILRGGAGVKQCVYIASATGVTCNNNNLYIAAAGGTNYVGNFNATGFATLAAWKTANGGAWDQASLSVDPAYLNPAAGNYIFTNLIMDNMGTPLGIATDMVNTPRDPVFPDMGAYEVPNAPCTAPPTAGTALANPTSGLCAGANIGLTLSGFSGGTGQTYQWEESFTPGGPFSPTTAALPSPLTTITATGSMYYRCAVTCGASTTYSTEVFVNVAAIPGTITSPSDTICVGSNVDLKLNNYTGNNVQWEYYNISTPSWTPIAGATTAIYSVANVTAATDFRAAVSCNSPVGTVYSDTFSVVVINPQVVETFPGSRCNTGLVTLGALAATGNTVNWYDALTGGNLLGSGNIYTTPSISTTTTYYAAAVSGTGGSLQDTVLARPLGTNTCCINFHMFLIQAQAQDVVLDKFFVRCTDAVNTLTSWNVYYRPNNYQLVPGANTSSNGWTLLFSVTGVPSAGTNAFTLLQANLGLTIPANQTYSFHIAPVSGVLGYTTEAIGTTTSSNGDLIFKAGNRGGGLFNCTTNGGMATIRVVYKAANCIGTRVPVTATINGTSSGTGLSTGGTTILNNHAISTSIDYTDACNDRVATVSNNPSALGNTAATVLTLPGVKTFGGKPYVPRVFDVTPTTNGSATVTLYALQSDFNAYNNYVTSNSLGLPLLPTSPIDPNAVNVRVTQFHGGALAGKTGPLGVYNSQNASFITTVTTVWTGQYWAMTFPVIGFSGFFIHTGATPLVFDLMDISAVNVGSRNRIDWSTANEDNGDKFELERSADGERFNKLAVINAKGEASTYSYWDENPVSGINYYRLKLIHSSGNTSYSKIVSAIMKGAGAFAVEAYPNPVSDVLTVKVFGAAGNNATVMITDVTGKMIKIANVSDNKAEINMAGLAQGVYLVKYSDSKQSQTIKVNKK